MEPFPYLDFSSKMPLEQTNKKKKAKTKTKQRKQTILKKVNFCRTVLRCLGTNINKITLVNVLRAVVTFKRDGNATL